jgi:5-methylcytosine-specific restriction endonuclease McrA
MPSRNRRQRWNIMQRLFQRQKNRCAYCREMMTLKKIRANHRQPVHLATRDHVVPRAYGGSDRQENIVICCKGCNSRRADLPADLFALIIIKEKSNEQ